MGRGPSKRINLGGGLGLNVSKSGISPSLRTKYGTISNKRVSVRTNIKGIGYSKTFGKAKGSGCVFFIMFFISTFLLIKIIL
jgi:hypothetical protein